MPATKLTYEDYLRIPDDGLRHEILAGTHVVSPSAGTPHQHVQMRLGSAFVEAIAKTGLGHVFSDLDCVIGAHDVVRPDLLVVLRAHERRLGPAKVHGPPDLIAEILSPSAPERDREHKLRRYESCEVPEYWIVDPAAKTIDQYGLYEGRYRHLGTESKHLQLAILPEIAIKLGDIWPPEYGS